MKWKRKIEWDVWTLVVADERDVRVTSLALHSDGAPEDGYFMVWDVHDGDGEDVYAFLCLTHKEDHGMMRRLIQTLRQCNVDLRYSCRAVEFPDIEMMDIPEKEGA